jgi:hypothetical protein
VAEVEQRFVDDLGAPPWRVEGKWRGRAGMNVADHTTRVKEPAGFVAVKP